MDPPLPRRYALKTANKAYSMSVVPKATEGRKAHKKDNSRYPRIQLLQGCSFEVAGWVRQLTAEYHTTLKQPLKTGGYADTQSLPRIRVST